ncbi:hypothetical protein BGZ65_004480 [Modicella reniformis]|uniref:Uncharacterized protein n=1 Tax=Modicella reniformis TaxID=1440133 RepID=A0A9P6MGW3_9FUNG|nr:hypothetical protein BGZ65_004480 [Modicella reniformis]
MAAEENVTAGQGRYYHDKKAFIHTQVRLLEAPIQLPSDWRRHAPRNTAKGGTFNPIPDTIVSTALSKLHTSSKKSSRLTFNNQSVRQLLEQLETNQYELRRRVRQGGIIIKTKAVQEILETDWVDMFPETWRQDESRPSTNGAEPPSSSSSAVLIPIVLTPPNSSRRQKYADLRSRIVALQKKYQNLKDRHDHYKCLQRGTRRLDAEEIQRNILSPDSEVVQELEKMRALCIDVGEHLQPTNPLDAVMEYL